MYDIDKYKLDNNVINIYQFGSRVYGSHNENSDYDYIIVCKELIDTNNINIKCYTHEMFIESIKIHDIGVLECLFLNDKFILKHQINYIDFFVLNKQNLRKSISTITSNSYVKAKKKLIVSGDYNLNLALKSLFHAFRILDYGIQIAKHNKIINYSSYNYLLNELFKLHHNDKLDRILLWNKIEQIYKQKFNNLNTEFKKLCPKEINIKNKHIELKKILNKYNVSDKDINNIINIFS